MNSETNTIQKIAVMSTGRDLAAAVLVVSVLVNLAVLITYLWVALDPAVNVAVNFT